MRGIYAYICKYESKMWNFTGVGRTLVRCCSLASFTLDICFLEFRVGRMATAMWITVGMFTRLWCHLVWSLVISKWSTHTLLPSVQQEPGLDNKVSPQGRLMEALKCFCRCFHTFSHSIVLSSYTLILTHTQRVRLHSCSIQSSVESYSIRTVTLWCWLDADLLESQNTLQTT